MASATTVDGDVDTGEDTSVSLVALSPAVGRSVIVFWVIVITLSTGWFFVDPRAFWMLTGAVACLIISLPLVLGRRRFEIVSPWTLLLLGGYLAFGLRGLFISLGFEADRTLDTLYFLGNSEDYFYQPALVFLAGLLLLTIGYLTSPPVARHPRVGTRPHLSPGAVTLLVPLCAAIGFAAFLMYAQSTGGLGAGPLSAKRTTISGAAVDASYQSHGELRVLNTYAQLAFWLQTAYYCYRKVPHGIATYRFWWLVLLFLNAALLPLYASTRSDLLYIVIGALLIEVCLRKNYLNLRTVGATVAIVLVIGSAMTSLRSTSNEATQSATVDTESVVGGFVLTRTIADVATTSHIVRSVPEELPYANGRTITAWLAAPIPRSIWPDKPVVSVGPEIGRTIYGNERAGVPPGVVGEAYWNFGIAGVLVIPLLAGVSLRRLQETWGPMATRSPEAAIVLAIVAVRPGLAVISNSVGYALFQVVQALILLLPILLIAGRSKEDAISARRRRR